MCDANVMLLCSEDVRTANVIACDPDGVDCLVLEREYVSMTVFHIYSVSQTCSPTKTFCNIFT